YREDTPNFASILREHGYRTGLIGKLHVNPASAFPFDFRAIPGANFNRKKSGADYAAEAARFFRESAGSPWFLSVNFPDAHLPFLAQANGQPVDPLSADEVQPMPWIGVNTAGLRKQVANYYNSLARLDHNVGLLLAELDKTGQAAGTAVFYIGDHGAQFPRGKGTVYEGGLRVPLIVRWPGTAVPGTAREELVSTVDLLPTALRAVGIAVPAGLPGLALQPLLRGEQPAQWRRYIFGFTTGAFPRACFVQHSIRDRRYKLISTPRPGTVNLDAGTYLDEAHTNFVVSGATAQDQATAPKHVQATFKRWRRPPRYELYDLQDDPQEWHDLAGDPALAKVKTRLIGALVEFQRRTRDPFLESANVDAFVEEQLANRDLGYRSNENFRWTYLDEFPEWRSRR
ncbi:MAG: sulfatase-like hydrolase/transferase, partial [bacterium]|nr:sulfatase-like hydrolase/transferase [bacterium]